MIITVPAGVTPRADIDVSDLTRANRDGEARWVDETTIDLPFDTEPTAAEQERIRRRILAADDAEESRISLLLAARDALKGDQGPVATAVRLLVEERLGSLALPAPLSSAGAASKGVRA